MLIQKQVDRVKGVCGTWRRVHRRLDVSRGYPSLSRSEDYELTIPRRLIVVCAYGSTAQVGDHVAKD
jgi:hypothetical protein